MEPEGGLQVCCPSVTPRPLLAHTAQRSQLPPLGTCWPRRPPSLVSQFDELHPCVLRTCSCLLSGLVFTGDSGQCVARRQGGASASGQTSAQSCRLGKVVREGVSTELTTKRPQWREGTSGGKCWETDVAAEG